jgi:hypothetical protein
MRRQSPYYPPSVHLCVRGLVLATKLCQIFYKIIRGVLHERSSKREFRQSNCRDSHTLLTGVNGVLTVACVFHDRFWCISVQKVFNVVSLSNNDFGKDECITAVKGTYC